MMCAARKAHVGYRNIFEAGGCETGVLMTFCRSMGEPAVRRWGTKGRWGIWAFESKRLDGQRSWHLRAGSLRLRKALKQVNSAKQECAPQCR
jgi:hypothetical protein